MSTTPFASLLVSVNGSQPASGGFQVNNGDTIVLSAADMTGWTAHRFEIFSYYSDFSTPAGWTLDSDGTIYTAANSPPSFTIPAGPWWGKLLFRLRVNDALTNQSADPRFTDKKSGVQVLSPHVGLSDVAAREENQFADSWNRVAQANLRLIDGISSSGGPPSGAAGGNLSGTFPNPVVAKINGAIVPTIGAVGNVLQVISGVSLGYGPVNLAGGANFVTGTLPIGNGGTGSTSISSGLVRSNGTSLSGAATVNLATEVTGSLAIASLAAGTQYQVVTAGVAGAPGWGTVHIDQAAALSGVGSDGQVAFASSGHFGFGAGLTWNSGTSTLGATNVTVATNLTLTALGSTDGPLQVVGGVVGVGPGGTDTGLLLNFADVATAEARVVTALGDGVAAYVRMPGELFFLTTASLTANHLDILSTPTPGRFWVANS